MKQNVNDNEQVKVDLPDKEYIEVMIVAKKYEVELTIYPDESADTINLQFYDGTGKESYIIIRRNQDGSFEIDDDKHVRQGL
ncbi:hypothetical protein [Chitinophaga sp. YIM B06452]|uniref:hypothetical protein n=1 Tax=Chitinophaga sp. YIM B06452 TaxID=3082158 RepID=UPI0031FEF777